MNDRSILNERSVRASPLRFAMCRRHHDGRQGRIGRGLASACGAARPMVWVAPRPFIRIARIMAADRRLALTAALALAGLLGSTAPVVSQRSGTNWEQTGIAPDIEAGRESVLAVASGTDGVALAKRLGADAARRARGVPERDPPRTPRPSRRATRRLRRRARPRAPRSAESFPRGRIARGACVAPLLANATVESWPNKFPGTDESYRRVNPEPDFGRLVAAAVRMWLDTSPMGYPGDAVDRLAGLCW